MSNDEYEGEIQQTRKRMVPSPTWFEIFAVMGILVFAGLWRIYRRLKGVVARV